MPSDMNPISFAARFRAVAGQSVVSSSVSLPWNSQPSGAPPQVVNKMEEEAAPATSCLARAVSRFCRRAVVAARVG